MTISIETARVQYSGNGVTAAFSTVFAFLANSHIQVIKRDTLAVETVLTEVTHYTVTGAGTEAAGTVTLVTPPATGETLTIIRNVPFIQDLDGSALATFNAGQQESALDKVWMALTQLKEKLSRALVGTDGGPAGAPTNSAWSPIYAVVTDGVRRVFQLTGWTGGIGTTPGHVGEYLGPLGFVTDITTATDIRGASGATGPGTGDMLTTNNLSDVANKRAAQDTLMLQGADIASAGTINLDTATGHLVDVTGTVTVTAITLSQGKRRLVRFTGSLTLTNNASIILPGGANIQTAAGDYAEFAGYAAGVVRCTDYIRANQHGADVASAGTVNLDTTTGEIIDITGTTGITAITLANGARRWVRFTGILTMTNGASLVLPGGANITTAAGDMALFVGYAAGVVRLASYCRLSGAPLAGGITEASDAEMWAGVATGTFVTPRRNASQQAWASLTDAATITIDQVNGRNFKLNPMAGNRTLGAMANAVPGTGGLIAIKQDGTGSRTLAYNAVYIHDGDTAIALGVTANKWSVLSYFVFDSTHIGIQLVAVNCSLG